MRSKTYTTFWRIVIPLVALGVNLMLFKAGYSLGQWLFAPTP